MCDTAMHHEALRKKRLLERKAMALQKMTEHQGGDITCMPTGGQMESEHGAGLHALHAEQSRMAATYGVAYQHQQYDHSRNGPQRPSTWNNVERQLKHEAKVLRDHNLYMGHTSCFKDLYDRNMLEPGQ